MAELQAIDVGRKYDPRFTGEVPPTLEEVIALVRGRMKLNQDVRVHIDALPLDYDHDAFVARFLERWPPGSSAYESYYRRIVDGPEYTLEQARPR